MYAAAANVPKFWDATNSYQITAPTTNVVLSTSFIAGDVGAGSAVIGASLPTFGPFGNTGVVDPTLGCNFNGCPSASYLIDASLIYGSPWVLELRDSGVVSGNQYSIKVNLLYLQQTYPVDFF